MDRQKTSNGRRSRRPRLTPARRPLWVDELELTAPPSSFVAPRVPERRGYDRARILVRLQGEPLGHLEVDLDGGRADPDDVVASAIDRFGPTIADRLGGDPRRRLAGPVRAMAPSLDAIAGADAPPVSVVIGTRNRTEHLVACIDAVLNQDYDGDVEVIVVDNAPSGPETEAAVGDRFGADDRVRYVLERRPGLSRARNLGLAQARHQLVAFLSDDIRVDPLWLRALARGFARRADVAVVAGLTPPLYLDTEEQQLFERSMGWGWRNGFQPEVIDDTAGGNLWPYRFGVATGANLAFRTVDLEAIGGFDEALGPGTIARGGEDLDAVCRIALAGGAVAFEPAVLGWHADRYDDRTFSGHMYTYGLGLLAFLTAHLADRRTRSALMAKIPFGIRHLFTLSALDRSEDQLSHGPARARYRLANAAGRLAGPMAYVRSRAVVGNRTRSGPAIGPFPDLAIARSVPSQTGVAATAAPTTEGDPAE